MTINTLNKKHERTASILKAIAHPLRLSIIYLLHHRGSITVSEIVAAIGKPQTMISQHLTKLYIKGLLTKERKGQCIYYGLKQADLGCLMTCIEQLDW